MVGIPRIPVPRWLLHIVNSVGWSTWWNLLVVRMRTRLAPSYKRAVRVYQQNLSGNWLCWIYGRTGYRYLLQPYNLTHTCIYTIGRAADSREVL